MRRTRGPAVLLPLSALLTTAPAHAGSPGLVYTDAWVDRWSGASAYVCVEGQVDDGTNLVGEWLYATAGTVEVPSPSIAGGPAYHVDCQWVNTAGASPGWWFHISLTFAGAGVADVIGTAGVIVRWAPSGPAVETTYTTYGTPPA